MKSLKEEINQIICEHTPKIQSVCTHDIITEKTDKCYCICKMCGEKINTDTLQCDKVISALNIIHDAIHHCKLNTNDPDSSKSLGKFDKKLGIFYKMYVQYEGHPSNIIKCNIPEYKSNTKKITKYNMHSLEYDYQKSLRKLYRRKIKCSHKYDNSKIIEDNNIPYFICNKCGEKVRITRIQQDDIIDSVNILREKASQYKMIIKYDKLYGYKEDLSILSKLILNLSFLPKKYMDIDDKIFNNMEVKNEG